MGGSPVAAQEASDDDGARVVVVAAAGSPVESASNPIPPPASAEEGGQEQSKPEARAEEAPEELKQAAAAAAAAPVEAKQEAAGVQAMAVTVARDLEAGPEASGSDQGGEKPSWFTPKRLLVMLCIINMLNYVDRGAIASNGVNGIGRNCSGGTCTSGSGIQGDFDLSNAQDGVLSSAFMVGLLVSSLIFASLAKRHNPFRLIGVGLLVWTIATAGCGVSFDFWSITICRMLVGVGEASFISLAAPFIDDNAPVAQKTSWLAMFYMCIPTGIALGYVYGGLVGKLLNWRAAFWGESILMVPFVILGFVIKPLELKGFTHNGVKEYGQMLNPDNQDPINSLLTISCVPQFLYLCYNSGVSFPYIISGYIAYNFVIGAYSYWGPKAGQQIYNMVEILSASADLMFGGITIVCGILGTLGGGFVLDKIGSTIPNAFKLLSGATFLGAIFCFGAFCFKSLYGFIIFFSIGEILVFATQAPVNFVCLHSVKPYMRALSMAVSTVSIHIFGDVPSSPLVGLLQDKINNWRATALILTSILFIAAVFWFIGIFVPSVDHFNEESEHGLPAAERSNLRPLLDDNEARASD
ncbi:hypothetical protein HU200_032593 [Digitaria exilis]|uniref:Major facilitator superfamily (MFS) profile domain-containing protein n=1 Tax=Digitaria exilis TaxID=1010633 RepID=A0A835BMR9_9POAL|nr:hypothetical protein HU200_032593 [Digitaria exilis]